MKTLAELAAQWEIDRWASAMREVVAEIRADATDYRARAASDAAMLVAAELSIRAEECDRIANMIDAVIDRKVSR